MKGEIDLIPAEYRQARRVRGWLRGLVVLHAAILLGIVGARIGIASATSARAQEVERIEAQALEARTQQEQLDALRAEQTQVERRLEVLRGLRGGPGAPQMFLALDRALDGSVQFLDWRFRRAGEYVESDADSKTVSTGYFIVVPAEPGRKRGRKGGERAWLLETHMEIRARAVDHSSLANFVGRLLEQPEIERVRVLNTHVRQYLESQAVDFELAVLVGSTA